MGTAMMVETRGLLPFLEIHVSPSRSLGLA